LIAADRRSPRPLWVDSARSRPKEAAARRPPASGRHRVGDV